jgi:uncharacterized integral membrane protein
VSDDGDSAERSTEESRSPVWLIIAGITAAILAIFIASNTQDTVVKFWWLDTSLPLWSVIIISVALGVVIGWSFGAWRRRRKKNPKS